MRVYVVIAGEMGQYSAPFGVFTSLEKANEYSKTMKLFLNIRIVSYVLDYEENY